MKTKRNQPEKTKVIIPIMKKLKWYEMTKDILWSQRLVAEDDPNCPAGTPDIVAMVNCHNGKLALLFIEGKRAGINKLRFEQQEFFNKMQFKPMTLCVVINDVRQLWPAIQKARNL